jgi:peptidoglycan hydrolase CwlO-like protein
MSIEITLLISVVSLSFAIYSGLKNMKRADTSDVERRATEQATVNVKLDNIAGDCRDIKQDMSSVKKDVQSLSERLVVVEQSVKSAHHRIDGLSGESESRRKDAE